MERTALQNLFKWKESKVRKPLLIRGARQVGKTWLMKEFGKQSFRNSAYINFESSSNLKNLFQEGYDIKRILTAIQIESGEQLDPDNTLIILDEIQEAKGGITSLKYFYENAPQYHIVAAGSLLGVSLHKEDSFPVGKIGFLDLFPMSFPEYLLALDQQGLLELIENKDWKLIHSFKNKYIQLLRQYFFTGGMPEIVSSFYQTNNFELVRELQNKILLAYEQDFSKHAPMEIIPRIRMLWNSIPAQLAKENKKFIYSAIRKGARAKDFELAIAWLIDSGLIHKINRVSKAGLPLKAYEDFNAFKLFIMDTGLLSAHSNISAKTIIQGNAIFEEFKGALTEQFVLQQLKSTSNYQTFYWSAENSQAEVDFVIQKDDTIVPIEVKAAENLQSKSLKSFNQRYSDAVAVRTSLADYRKESWLCNIPLYAIHSLDTII